MSGLALTIIAVCGVIHGTSAIATSGTTCTFPAGTPMSIRLLDGTTDAECEQIITHLVPPGVSNASWACGYTTPLTARSGE